MVEPYALPFSAMPTTGNVITNALQLTSPDFHRKVYAMAKELGPIFKIPLPPPKGTIVAVADPQILKEVTAEEFKGVTKPPGLYKTFAVLCSTAEPEPTYPVLATDDEDKWRVIRGGFSAAFSKEAVVQYLPVLAEEASKVLTQVGIGDQDVLELVGRISLSTTGRVMFGYDAFDCTDLDQPATFWKDVIAARKGAVDVARSPIKEAEQKLCPFSSGPQAYATSIKAVYKKYEEIYSQLDSVTATKTTANGLPNGRAANGIGGVLPTILGAFSTTPDPKYPDGPMSKEDTIATVGNLVVAGTLPAATAVAYTLCLISCNAEVQVKVHQELDAAGLSYGKRPFAAEDIAKLPYLTNVIKETMRVIPTVPQVNRETTEDLVLGGYTVPKGTLLFLSMGGMHTSPFNFIDPGRFWPERWEKSPEKSARDPKHPKASCVGNLDDLDGSFAPFSTNSRACLGQHWARLAILATVASVMSRFELLAPRSMTADSLAAEEIFSVSAYPKTPLILTFKPRTRA